MSGLKKHIYEEKNGLHYTLNGDYYLPDLKLPEEHRPIGKYGRMHREYLREVHPARLNTLTLTGEKNRYLRALRQNAEDTYRINMGMNNTRVYLERQIYSLRFMGISLQGFENLGGQLTLLCFPFTFI